LQESRVQEELNVTSGKGYADRRAKQEPTETQPQAVARHFSASQGTAKIEGMKMVEAKDCLHLGRDGVNFAWQFTAGFFNGLGHGFLRQIFDFQASRLTLSPHHGRPAIHDE
jgi:hypothetical protein